MILYFDTSALIKIYANEPNSGVTRAAECEAELRATSIVTYAEMQSALARKHRSGDISPTDFENYRKDFERDWLALRRIPLDETTVRRAGQLAGIHRLRALDAIHLASAEVIQIALGPITFACFDIELSRAASSCGMALLPS